MIIIFIMDDCVKKTVFNEGAGHRNLPFILGSHAWHAPRIAWSVWLAWSAMQVAFARNDVLDHLAVQKLQMHGIQFKI